MDLRVTARLLLCLAIAATTGAAAGATMAPRADRDGFAADWRAQGLAPADTRSFDLLYLRPGAAAALHSLQLAPVDVQMHPDWQRANRSFERARLRPQEVQRLKDDVGRIVADELRQAFADAPAPGGAPVLQARVLDLYLNAPDMQEAVATRSYTRSYGDMVLVAEVRDPGGRLLLGAWDHRPAREFATARLTTRVENAIEVRAAAHGWAKLLRREFDRLAAAD